MYFTVSVATDVPSYFRAAVHGVLYGFRVPY